MDAITRVLFQYDLVPTTIEKRGCVYRVTTRQGRFALKPLTMDQPALNSFAEITNRLKTLKIRLPQLIMTKYGDRFALDAGIPFYLTLWLDDRPLTDEEKAEILIKELAQLHRLTAGGQPTDSESAGDRFDRLLRDWMEEQRRLESFALQAEHRLYPSPFEQRFLNQFHHIMADAERASAMMNASRGADGANRFVLCHGQPVLSHVLETSTGPILLNFEQAVWDTPVRDIAMFFTNNAMAIRNWDKLYQLYIMGNPLSIEEKKALTAWLTHPGSYPALISRYCEDPQKKEVDYIRGFERIDIHRRLIKEMVNDLEKEISDESLAESDPSLQQADIQEDKNN